MKFCLNNGLRLVILVMVYWITPSCSKIFINNPPKPALAAINSHDMGLFISHLASDSLLGRNTPGAGLDSAAAYISRHYQSWGIKPASPSFYQVFYLCQTSLGDENYMKIKRDTTIIPISIKSGFIPFEISSDAAVDAPLVFAGYGISAPEYKYDDYQNIDVKGKIVVVFRHEPQQNDSNSKFNGAEDTKFSSLASKMKTAISHGAVGMIVLTEPLNYPSMRPKGFPWPSLSKVIPHDAIPLNLCKDQDPAIPVIHAGETLVNAVFQSIDSLKHLQRIIDSTCQPHSFPLPNLSISMKADIQTRKLPTQNVVGMIEGSDPVLKNEFLIIGAHYDHVGFKRNGKPGEDTIFNGADDNASGTAAVMSLAKAFSMMPEKPKRTVVFINFAGEEKGLYGSKVYTEHPLFPLSNTVAMLNLDMISRNNPDSLQLIGTRNSPDIAGIIQKMNRRDGFKLLMEDGWVLGGSDHYYFMKKEIPFMFFFSGLHPDYHTVRDNPGTINADKAARVARLVLRTAWFIANDHQHYRFVKTNDQED